MNIDFQKLWMYVYIRWCLVYNSIDPNKKLSISCGTYTGFNTKKSSLSYPQENVKTRQPQLMHESRVYKILQGGSMQLIKQSIAFFQLVLFQFFWFFF